MKVALMQPTFLPWLGYFELMAKADRFVFLDDFQYVHRSFDHRNRFFFNHEVVQWATCHIDKKSSYRTPFNQTYILEDGWRKKLWQTIEHNYGKAEFFHPYAEVLRPLFLCVYENLAAQNIALIRVIAGLLGINTEIYFSSEYNFRGKRSTLLYDILKFYEADTYLSAYHSFDYMQADGVFPTEDIKVYFQNAIPKPYPQVGSKNFVPYLSAIDALFNVGAKATRQLVENMTEHWLSWSEMEALPMCAKENHASMETIMSTIKRQKSSGVG